VQTVAIRTGPPPSGPKSSAADAGADRPPPDPLDDATYQFPTASADPYAFARFAGHLPALRLPTPQPGGLLPRATARQALVVWSVVDVWAFVAALRLGPSPLAPVALAGLIATCWHLRSSSCRRRTAMRCTASPGSALAPLGATASRHGCDHGRRPGQRPHFHTTFSPRRLRRRRPLIGTRRPSDWWPAGLSPAMLMAGGSVVSGAIVHSALSAAGSLH
jgi:hypothetical protein